jgi:hypothetical protein
MTTTDKRYFTSLNQDTKNRIEINLLHIGASLKRIRKYIGDDDLPEFLIIEEQLTKFSEQVFRGTS